jgi:hypothetical protein
MDGDMSIGTLTASGNINVAKNANVSFVINSTDRYSKLQANSLTMNGTVVVTLGSTYLPKSGDMFTLWTAEDFGGTPSWSLPQLPSGLFWDTTDLELSGVLRVTDTPSAISLIAADAQVDCEVFTTTGIRLGSFQSLRRQIRAGVKKLGVVSGTYIVRVIVGRNTTTETVVIR